MSFTVLSETTIAAPPSLVWQVLTDVAAWEQWSTWLRYEGGKVAIGEKLQLRLTPPEGKGYAFSPEILVLEPNKHFAWIGRTGIKGVFDGEHHFELEPTAESTKLTNRERYSGLLSPLMKRLEAMKGAAAGFDAMNAEIKQRAESLAEGS